MANINVTVALANVSVNETVSNITITDSSNVRIGNITTTQNVISVTQTPSVVNVSLASGISNAEVRSTLSAISPILYDQGNGIFSFDSNASFAGKTTDDLAQGTTNIYFSTAGASVNTTNLPEGTNQYFTNARVLSAILDSNVKLKQYSETVIDAGTLNGNITLNAAQGTLFYGTINGDITGISVSNFNEGSSLTLVLTQDGVGNNDLDTTTHASNWTNWYFVNDESGLSLTAASKSYVTLIKVNGVINAAVVGGEPSLENYVPVNRQVFDNDIVTLAQGPFGGFYANTNLAFGNAYLNTTTGDGSQRFLQSYNNDTGAWVTTDDGAISGLTVVDTGNDEGVVFGRFNPYSATPLSTTRALIALKGSDTIDIADLTSNSLIRPAISLSTKVDGTTTFNNLKLSLGDAPPTERFGVEDNATLGAARFVGNVIIQNSNLQTNTTFKFGAVGNELFQLDHGTSNVITARATLTSNSNITTTANVQGNFFLGNGSQLTGITSLTNAQVISHIATVPLTVGGNLTVNGNINATGNINVQNVEDLYVRDQTIVLNANAASPANVQIVSNRPGFANTELKWNEQIDRWTFTNDGTTYYNLPTSTSDVSEGTNLYFTDARVRSNVSATTATGITYDSGTGIFSLASIPNSSLSNSTVTINGKTVALGGSNTLTTTDISEGTNLYYTTDRANTAIGAYQGSINTTGNIQGNYILGNGALLTGITSGTVTQVNTGENLTGGPITSTGTIGLANALANVNSVTAQANVNFAINTDKKLILSQKYKNTTTYSGNISGQGYAVIGGRLGTTISHTGANALPTLYITGGFTIAGTNEISNVTVQWQGNSAAASVSDIKSNYAFTAQFGNPGQTPFPQGTYVTSVDSANSKVFMSQIETNGFNAGVSNGAFIPGARDPETGLLISFISAQAAGVGAANVIVETLVHTSGLYAYPASGWNPSYFTYAIDTASDYNMSGTTNLAWAKTSIEGNKSILNSPYGLTLGGRTDATQMGTDDTRPRFGLNVLWDGLTPPAEFGNTTPSTGVLLRQYNDPAFTDLRKASLGPSVIFTVSQGNASQSFRETYARNNTELGKIAWVIPNNANPQPSFQNPQTWINCLTGQDADIGNGSGGPRISGAGMYFGNSPDVLSSGRALYFANTKGRTLLAGGFEGSTTANITLAPMDTTINTGNSVQMYDNAIVGKLFANVGYANMSSQTGSRLTITNGAEVSAPGNFVIEIDRNVTPAGVANVVLDAAPYGIMDGGDIGGIADRALVGIYYSGSSGIAPTTTAITINSVTGPGAANINGQTFYINDTESLYSATAYYLYSDAGLTTPVTYSSLGADVYATDGGYLEYTATPASVSKNWSFELEQAVQDLKLKADGNTKVTFTDTGNITATAFYGDGGNLTNVTATANTFDTIVVSGQSNVVASGSSNLTLVAGSGMSITTNAGTDTITFTSTGGYGNVEVANFLANGYGSNTISTTGNITAGNTIVNGVSFNTGLSVAPTSGQIRYNADYGTLQAGLNGSNVMLMGQDLVVYARNDEANTLVKGEVVRISGASGDKATIKRATNNSDANSATSIGIVKQDIAAGQLGYIVSQGVVDGINLGAYTAGDLLYLGNVAGTFTNVKPSAPQHIVFIGVVERANPGNGQIFVRVQNGFELDEIHDVQITSLQANDMLIRNTGNTLWINQNFGTTVTNSNITLKQYQETRVDLGSTGGNITLNMANGSIFAMTATSNISNIALSNAGVGASGTLIITQDGTGGKTLTTTSAWKFAGASKTLSTAAGAIDIISFLTDGTTVYATLSKGYA